MKRRRFLKLPEFPGGKTFFENYIKENLVYPEEAIKHNIEGIVFLSAMVDDDGMVHEIAIEKGIGFGCDEEAIRLLGNLHFGHVRNQGVRVQTRKKFRIPFRMKKENNKIQLSYSLKKKAVKPADTATTGTGYSYTISWGNADKTGDHT
jgi:hypothetical protein